MIPVSSNHLFIIMKNESNLLQVQRNMDFHKLSWGSVQARTCCWVRNLLLWVSHRSRPIDSRVSNLYDKCPTYECSEHLQLIPKNACWLSSPWASNFEQSVRRVRLHSQTPLLGKGPSRSQWFHKFERRLGDEVFLKSLSRDWSSPHLFCLLF